MSVFVAHGAGLRILSSSFRRKAWEKSGLVSCAVLPQIERVRCREVLKVSGWLHFLTVGPCPLWECFKGYLFCGGRVMACLHLCRYLSLGG